MLLSDKTITELCQGDRPMIAPFVAESMSVLPSGHPVTSFGRSSYGYDLSLGNKFKVLKKASQLPGARIIDPVAFDPELFTDLEVRDGDVFVVPPQTCVLAVTKERIIMPADVAGVCMQKSTIARCFLEVTVTPLEPGWEGYLTLEMHNKTEFPVHLRPGMGIVQLLLYKGDQECEVPYGSRHGKYQNQPAEPVIARAKIATAEQPNPPTHLQEVPKVFAERCPCANDCGCHLGFDPNAPRQDQRAVASVAASTSVPKQAYEEAAEVLKAQKAAEPITVAQAFHRLMQEVQEDHGYAWSWYCNLAMPIYDTLPAEITPPERLHMGRYAANHLMQHIFGVDIAKTPLGISEQVPTTPSTITVTVALNAANAPVTEESVVKMLETPSS